MQNRKVVKPITEIKNGQTIKTKQNKNKNNNKKPHKD